jgi:hypothetical protein
LSVTSFVILSLPALNHKSIGEFMLTRKDFFKGRDVIYRSDLTPDIEANARLTLSRVNALLAWFYDLNSGAAMRGVNSGWRPPAVNRGVRNAAKSSHHLIGRACDLSDDDEALDKWCLSKDGQRIMADIGLWMEHPSATPRWCHLQTIAPRSGKRVFFP